MQEEEDSQEQAEVVEEDSQVLVVEEDPLEEEPIQILNSVQPRPIKRLICYTRMMMMW